MYSCYVIANDRGRTYTGYAKCVDKRLRQHNGSIKGGAKSTRGKGPWRLILVVTGEESLGWTKEKAMSFEWRLKHDRTGPGIAGLLGAMPHVVARFEGLGVKVVHK